ncbi:MAG: pyruvate ferredoxin oxidoreductase [Candidatus Woesearchaeota archaeon]
MPVDILDGNTCAAMAARLARVQCIPVFPVTPQTEQIETFARWKSEKKWNFVFNQVESEHSVASAAFGSAITGARTYTATSSQGLLLMHEMLPIISGSRVPMVMSLVSRAISAPITLWPDHNDILAMRDSGWITFVCETNQEVIDLTIMAFKISEHKKIMLPVLVCMDGFIHSYTRTEVDVPEQRIVDRFLPKPDWEIKLDVNNPMSLSTPAMGLDYMKFRAQLHRAMLDSLDVIKQTFKEWKQLTGREYDFVEEYKLDDAKAAIVCIGANTTIAKSCIDIMRKKGKKVGLLQIMLYRPFPEKTIREALKKIKNIAVVDQNICPGMGGILHPEVKAAMYGTGAIVSSYILGLGGNFVSEKDYEQILEDAIKSKKEVKRWVM